MIQEFSDILYLSNRDIATFLYSVKTEFLLMACFDCDELVLRRLYAQFTKQGRRFFSDDLRMMKPPSAKEIADAQNDIVEVLQELERDGCLLDLEPKISA